MKKVDDPAIRATLELLVETFPKCFSISEGHRRPLKIGIYLDILAVFDGVVTPKELSRALRVYVGNRAYRSRLVAGAVRTGLGGEPAGVVTAAEVPPPLPPRPQSQPPAPISKTATPIKMEAKGPKRLSLADLRAAAKQRVAGGMS